MADGLNSAPDNLVEREDEAPSVTSLDGDHGVKSAGAPWRSGARRWRLGLRLGGLAAALALVAALIAALAPQVAILIPRPLITRPLPDILALDLSPNLSNCATTGYWSPDGRRIAVLRSSYACGVTDRSPDVYVYDAVSGAQVAAYSVTAPIQSALNEEGAAGWSVAYDSLSWEPSQGALAVLWNAAQPPSETPRASSQDGLALIALSGPRPGAISILLGDGGPLPTPPGGRVGYPLLPGRQLAREWDVTGGGYGAFQILPAQVYAWTPDDGVVPITPFPGGGPSQAVPIDGQAFSAWRTGALSVAATAPGQSQAGAPTAFALLTLTIRLWSPDSRYLLLLDTVARVPGAPGTATIANAQVYLPANQVSTLPVAPTSDRALRAALGLLGAHGATQVALLWSPNGRRLVAIPSGEAAPATAALVYDTATGALLARISAGQSEIPGAQGSDANATISGAAWSPDGRRLLVGVTGLRFNLRVYGEDLLG
ncbi:MAG TPA: hypothetical protein VF808_03365 [Ktedonobacterales bacterium]